MEERLQSEELLQSAAPEDEKEAIRENPSPDETSRRMCTNTQSGAHTHRFPSEQLIIRVPQPYNCRTNCIEFPISSTTLRKGPPNQAASCRLLVN